MAVSRGGNNGLAFAPCAQRNFGYLAAAVVMFWVLKHAVRAFLLAAFPAIRAKYRELRNEKARATMSNVMVSLVHSLISAVTVTYCFATRVDMLSDPLYGSCGCHSIALAVSQGYFIYDLFDMVSNRLYMSQPVVYVHHFGVIIPSLIGLWECIGAPILTLPLIVEWNTVAQHVRRIFTLFGMKKTRAFVWNDVVLLGTFIPFRIVLHGYVYYLFFIHMHELPSDFHRWVGILGFGLLNVLNVAIGIYFLKVDYPLLRRYFANGTFAATKGFKGNSHQSKDAKEQ